MIAASYAGFLAARDAGDAALIVKFGDEVFAVRGDDEAVEGL